MNILFITKELPYPPNNGHRIRTLNILRSLSEKNNINLICFSNGNKDEEYSKALQGHYSSLTVIPARQIHSRWKLLLSAFFGLFSLLPFIVRKRYSTSMKEAIKRILREDNNDLIICDSIYHGLYIPHTKVTKILCEHNIESMIINRYLKTEKNLFKKLYAYVELKKMRRYEASMWKKFNRCFVVSLKDRELMKKAIRDKTEILPNGVDIDYFCPDGMKVKPFSLIYTGQMDWYPNEDAVVYFLTDIYPLIKRYFPQVSFWVVGKNPSEKIKKLAKKDRSIIITGFVDDVRSYIAQAEVMVVPLRIGSGTRLKILEAMAMGKAVVSTSIGCEGLDVSSGINIEVADRPKDFARAVIDLIRIPEKRRLLGERGKELVEQKYTWSKVTEDLNRIFSQFIEVKNV